MRGILSAAQCEQGHVVFHDPEALGTRVSEGVDALRKAPGACPLVGGGVILIDGLGRFGEEDRSIEIKAIIGFEGGHVVRMID